MKQKIAIVWGATGQVGSYLSEFLIYKGYKVIGVKRRTSLIATDRIDHLLSSPNFKLEYGNVNDVYSIHRLVQEYKPDEIYNQAAMSHVRVSFDCPEETIQTITLGTLNILNAIKEINPKTKLYSAGSSEQWGKNTNVPHNENSIMMPCSPYAIAKVAAFHLVQNYRNSYGLFACSGITQNMESERRGETFVSKKITMAAAKIKLGLQEELHLGNLEAKRDWQHCKDAVEAMWLILQQKEPQDFVIGTGETHSVKEFLETVFEYANLNPYQYLKIDKRLFRPEEVPILQANPEKAKRILGWESKIKFKELCKLMYEHDLNELKKQHNK